MMHGGEEQGWVLTDNTGSEKQQNGNENTIVRGGTGKRMCS